MEKTRVIGGAHYRCDHCGAEWLNEAGPQPDCPSCGYRYMDWLNYDEMFGSEGEYSDEIKADTG